MFLTNTMNLQAAPDMHLYQNNGPLGATVQYLFLLWNRFWNISPKLLCQGNIDLFYIYTYTKHWPGDWTTIQSVQKTNLKITPLRSCLKLGDQEAKHNIFKVKSDTLYLETVKKAWQLW